MRNLTIAFLLFCVGCASIEVYNPVASSQKGTFLLNESSLRQIKLGMKQEEVHQVMGDEIIIGYAYQKSLSDENDVSQASAADYKPVTIKNPYKTQEIKSPAGDYVVEYYVHQIQQPDGIISDSELVPLYFRGGILVGQGKDYRAP